VEINKTVPLFGLRLSLAAKFLLKQRSSSFFLVNLELPHDKAGHLLLSA